MNSVSVYYQDLKSGRWFGINQNENYDPASLLKIPIMIAYFKEAESDPSILSKKIYYQQKQDFNTNQNIALTKSIQSDQNYTIEELINSMIVNSDNNSKELLAQYIDPSLLNEVYSDLNIPLGAPDSDFMSVRSYSYFFRVLYNSTYLDHDFSEKALALLTQTNFKDGIVAGIPDYISVAHKFGERRFINSSNNQVLGQELHDCGIIYDPIHPYLLCIMTRGVDISSLENIIQKISAGIYQDTVDRYQQ